MAEEIFKYITTLLKKKPRSTIFHYTNQRGILGITESNSIWATNIHHLNDAAEFSHAIGIAKSELRKYKGTLNDKTEKKIINSLENHLERIERISIFVCSFSEEGDLLSQWRGYCQNGSGFSIGFNYSSLKNAIEKQGFILAPCVYDTKKQHVIIQELIAKILIVYLYNNDKTKIDDGAIERMTNEFINDFVKFAPVIKHPSFSEEKEWRLISQPVPINHPQVRHREGNSLITPYYNFKLTYDENLSISKVIIGPTSHIDMAMSSIPGLLTSRDVKWESIEPSRIPYREL
jgi:hypothetical protein